MKATLFVVFVLVNLNLNAQEINHRAEQKKMVKIFISDYNSYEMDIEAAGLATIKDAKLVMEGELYIAYAYVSGNENRNGKMTLLLTDEDRLKGNWKTNADNGNSYNGSLYFTFSENGEASGHYKYGGTDYKITILKKK
ncbi:hypothetical protein [uncultured Aquimarina sp.]|uniref:hypothetical protein n=1 Tax=uncultured Aquimarina sp. TaxID=575652 RepID=UPI00261F0B49|nr:hypothetical protein [uncultured Aquimarina sp.]